MIKRPKSTRNFGPVGFPTIYVAYPIANFLLRANFIHRNSKTRATLLGILFAIIGGILLILLPAPVGPSLALLAWILSYAFDVLDGEIARREGTASAAGGGVDAVADVIVITITTSAVLIKASTSPDLNIATTAFTLFAAGATLRSVGPLWTVATRYVKQENATHSVSVGSAARTNGLLHALYKAIASCLRQLGDPIIVYVLLVSCVSLQLQPWFFIAGGLYTLVIGGTLAVLALFALLVEDGFR